MMTGSARGRGQAQISPRGPTAHGSRGLALVSVLVLLAASGTVLLALFAPHGDLDRLSIMLTMIEEDTLGAVDAPRPASLVQRVPAFSGVRHARAFSAKAGRVTTLQIPQPVNLGLISMTRPVRGDDAGARPVGFTSVPDTRNSGDFPKWSAQLLWHEASITTGDAYPPPRNIADDQVDPRIATYDWAWSARFPVSLCTGPPCQLPIIRLPAPAPGPSFWEMHPLAMEVLRTLAPTQGRGQIPTNVSGLVELIVPGLGLSALSLQFGPLTLATSNNEWRLSAATGGYQIAFASPLWTPLQDFGVESSSGIHARTPWGLEMFHTSAGVQVLQRIATSFGNVFAGYTPQGPVIGSQFGMNGVSWSLTALVSDGQVKTAAGVALQAGNLGIAYAVNPTGNYVTLSYLPRGGPLLYAAWSRADGLRLALVASYEFGRPPAVATPAVAAPAVAAPDGTKPAPPTTAGAPDLEHR